MKYSFTGFFSKCYKSAGNWEKNDISEKKPQVHLIIIREGPPIKKIPSISPLVHFIWPPTIKYERVLPNALHNGFMATIAFGHTVCSSAPVSIKSS